MVSQILSGLWEGIGDSTLSGWINKRRGSRLGSVTGVEATSKAFPSRRLMELHTDNPPGQPPFRQ